MEASTKRPCHSLYRRAPIYSWPVQPFLTRSRAYPRPWSDYAGHFKYRHQGDQMTQGDLLGLLFSYLYAFTLLIVIEAIRRWRNYPTDFTRKLVHIGAGMWIWVVLLLFDHWWLAIIPTGTFIILNALFLRFRIFSAMDPKE